MGGFSLLELIISLGIVAVLIGLLFPVLLTSSDSLSLLKCVQLRKKLYEAAAMMYREEYPPVDTASAGFRSPLPTDMGWWQERLKKYGAHEEHWLCPALGRPEERNTADFYYPGVTPYDFHFAPDKGNLYLFVEKQLVHGDVSVVVKADGTVTFERLVGF